MKHRDDLEIAMEAARAAGELLRARWNTPLDVRHKGAIDLVTEVDLQAEAAVIDVLTRRAPGDTIVAEEGFARAGDTGRRWLVDPLDGTTNFSHGFPHFCVSIAVCDAAGPLAGVVYDPLRDWMFSAARGGGAFRNGQRLRVSSAPTLATGLVATGFPYDRRTNPDNNLAEFGRVLLRSQGGRRAGSAALDLAYVAAGWIDAYWEFRLQPWDIAAGALLVTEAGGKLSDPKGGPFEVDRGVVAATNGWVHDELIALLRAEEAE